VILLAQFPAPTRMLLPMAVQVDTEPPCVSMRVDASISAPPVISQVAASLSN